MLARSNKEHDDTAVEEYWFQNLVSKVTYFSCEILGVLTLFKGFSRVIFPKVVTFDGMVWCNCSRKS